MSNDDENKHPLSAKNPTGKKSSSSTTRQIQYRILPRRQPDESTSVIKKSEINNHDMNTPNKSQRNRREFFFLN